MKDLFMLAIYGSENEYYYVPFDISSIPTHDNLSLIDQSSKTEMRFAKIPRAVFFTSRTRSSKEAVTLYTAFCPFTISLRV